MCPMKSRLLPSKIFLELCGAWGVALADIPLAMDKQFFNNWDNSRRPRIGKIIENNVRGGSVFLRMKNMWFPFHSSKKCLLYARSECLLYVALSYFLVSSSIWELWPAAKIMADIIFTGWWLRAETDYLVQWVVGQKAREMILWSNKMALWK